MSNNLSVFFILILSFNLSWASPIPFHVQIKTLKTEHFEVIYYAKQQDLAEHYAKQLEKAHTFLRQVFVTMPDGRIPVVINDSTDLANGFATRVPYPYSMLFPVMPDLNDTLSEPNEWSLELTTHEIAHVLSFEPASGVIRGLRSVFGSIVAPNLLLPNWWKEGLSVWTETAVGTGGRLRSNYQNAALRSWLGEKDLQEENIAKANEVLTSWPWGSRPYFFGSLVMGYLVKKNGEERTGQLVEHHGGRVPYFLSGATKPTVNQNYEEIYSEALDFWQDRAQAQLETLSTLPFDQGVEVQTDDVTVRSPSLNAQKNAIAWVSVTKKPDSRIKLAQLDEKGRLLDVKSVFQQKAIREARFFPRSNKILINAVMPASAQEMYSDLFVYDITTQKSERLTKKLRGREARINDKENLIVFVGLEGGRTHLKTVNLVTKKIETLFSSQFDERIASPLFLDNSRILFSFLEKGQESLRIYDIKTKTSSRLTQFGQRMRRPVLKDQSLYFLSDKNGTFNIYKTNLEGTAPPRPISHVKTTVLDYDMQSDNKAFMTLLTRQGPRLFQFENLQPLTKPDRLPAIQNSDFEYTHLKPPQLPKDFKVEPASRPYKLWPHYWIPFYAGSSAKNGALISLSTNGQDPSLQHSYSAQLLYDTGTEDLSYSLNYTNLTMKAPWLLQSSRIVRSFPGSTATYSNQVHAIAVAPDTSAWTQKFSSQFALLYARYEDRLVNYERSGAQMSLNYSDAEQTLWMISPESGSTLQFSATHFLKSSNLESYNQARVKATTYMSRWLPERHAFMVDIKGLATDERIPSILGDASTFFVNELTSNFLIRGYGEGQFIGRNLANANLEYRFPLSEEFDGWGLFPFFIKRIHGALAYDALALDGFAYRQDFNNDVAVDRTEVFTSAGAEMRLDTTIGYLLPMQVVIGMHQPLEREFRKQTNFLFQVRTALSF